MRLNMQAWICTTTSASKMDDFIIQVGHQLFIDGKNGRIRKEVGTRREASKKSAHNKRPLQQLAAPHLH